MYKTTTPPKTRLAGTARRRLRATGEGNADWQSLLENSWFGVLFRQRLDWTFEFVSPRVLELTGFAPAELQRDGALFWQAVHEADADELRQQLRRCVQFPDGMTTNFRLRNARTGRVAYLTEFRRPVIGEDGKLAGYEGFWQDTTRQTISERRLAAAAWKETLAVLTMGLAHDFNNVMSGILSLSDSFLCQIDQKHPFHEGLSLIRHNAQQAAHLVQRIVHLHQGKAGQRAYHNLNDLVSDTADLLRKVVPRRITLDVETTTIPLPLYADAVELRQLIINLALNATDAMPDRGRLSLKTSLHDRLPEMLHFRGVAPRLPAVCLAVADTGCGIKPYHLQSIFDPFFTTKAKNKGCGLGLHNACVFVEKHQGAISVDSVEGEGATFRLWLPQSDLTEAKESSRVSAPRRRNLLVAGSDRPMLETIAHFWRQHGCQVVVGGPNVTDQLQSGEYHFDGLLIVADRHEANWTALFDFVQREKLPWKLILQIIGLNQDELDSGHLMKADLIISEDMPEHFAVAKMNDLFAGQEESRP
jgi:PAS domain S-box-containing protein